MNKKIQTTIYIILLTIFGLKFIITLNNIIFHPENLETYFWTILILSFLINWKLTLKSKIIFSLSWIFICLISTFAIVDTIKMTKTDYYAKPIKFKGYEKEIWSEFEQRPWGGIPYCRLAVGKTYFYGFFSRKETQFEIDCDEVELNLENYKIPKTLNFEHRLEFWKEKGLLFDFNNKTCYHLKK